MIGRSRPAAETCRMAADWPLRIVCMEGYHGQLTGLVVVVVADSLVYAPVVLHLSITSGVRRVFWIVLLLLVDFVPSLFALESCCLWMLLDYQ